MNKVVPPGQGAGASGEFASVPPTDAGLERLGRYTLVRRLDFGGMAEVFLARQDGAAGFRKTVVIKRILPQLAADRRFVEMFQAEANLAAMLSHTNIVQILELGEVDKTFFIAMEYVDGITLHRLAVRAWRNQRPLPTELVCSAISDAALGLHYAHVAKGPDGEPMGLVHRDITPDNLMIDREGVTKVLDFGIAKPMRDMSRPATETGEMKGKLPFVPPEQITGDPLDARADIYTLGVGLYWLLTGRRPITGKNELELMTNVIKMTPEPPSRHNPVIHAELDDLVMRMLQKDPARRPQTAEQVHEELTFATASRRRIVVPFVAEIMALPRTEDDDRAPATLDGRQASKPSTDRLRTWNSDGSGSLSVPRPIFDLVVDQGDADAPSEGPEELDDAALMPFEADAPGADSRAAGFANEGTPITSAALSSTGTPLSGDDALEPLGGDGEGVSSSDVAVNAVNAVTFVDPSFDRPSHTPPTTTTARRPLAAILGTVAAVAVVATIALLVRAGGSSGDAAEPVVAVVTQPTIVAPVVQVPVADPVVADPVGADPVVADPVVADPVVADPGVTEPVKDPALKEPVKDPAVKVAAVAPAITGAMRMVAFKAPASVRWFDQGKPLTITAGKASLPTAVKSVVAVDSQRGVRTVVAIPPSGPVDYAKLPRGRLMVRANPYADVFVGKDALGPTPFPPLDVVAGTYTIRLVHEGREIKKSVTIKADNEARVIVDFTKP